MSQKNKTNTEAQKPKKNTKNTKEIKPVEKNSYTGEIITCILALPTIFIIISLSSYYSRYGIFPPKVIFPEDFFTGLLGFRCASQLNRYFGIISFYIPIAVIAFVLIFFLKKQLWKHILLNIANFVMLIQFLSMITGASPDDNKVNAAGDFLYHDFFRGFIGQTGFILLFIIWMMLFIILTFHVSFFKLFAKMSLAVKEYYESDSPEQEKAETEKEEDREQVSDPNYIDLSGISHEEAETGEADEPDGGEESENVDGHEELPEPEEPEEWQKSEESEPEGIPIPEDFPEEDESGNADDTGEEAGEEHEPEDEMHDNIEEKHHRPENGQDDASNAAAEQEQEIEVRTSDMNQKPMTTTVLRKLKDYKLPPLSLLVAGESLEKSEKREKEVEETCRIIARKLGEHKIKVEVKGATIGPLVTMYEIKLGEGVKVSHVLGMEQDLTVAVSGKKVRIVGFIPGKPYIGIEVPNEERLTIRLKSILESSVFSDAAKKGLPIALGLDVAGKPCAAILNKMPHVLVAGTTGSGKSVGINSFIISILYTLTPDEVKFIMIDPKGNEFNMYEGIPHMLLPVVVDSKKAAKALQWAVVEMDNRFRILAENKVKDIGEYNQKIEKINKNLASEEAYIKKMPFIVVVIDEFADLMMVAGKDVETAVARIAQKARAVGIHLIIATQKPTRDVVTGLIKSNLPVRIAFKVASAMDSRVILDTNGAEALLGNGDMLYIAPGTSIPTRIHGSFVSTEEMEAVIDFIKQEAGGEVHPEDILENFQNEGGGGGNGSSGGGDDLEDEPLYNEIIDFITETGKCSASMLQRKFSIGYNRAARIVDKLEEKGIVSPGDGSKPRTVIGKK